MARNRTRPAVLSMSVEGFQSTILDDMVERLYQDNVAVVVAAGNTQVCICPPSLGHEWSVSLINIDWPFSSYVCSPLIFALLISVCPQQMC